MSFFPMRELKLISDLLHPWMDNPYGYGSLLQQKRPGEEHQPVRLTEFRVQKKVRPVPNLGVV